MPGCSTFNSSIRDNFREIYHAVNFPSNAPLPLVSNFSGSRIYDSRYAWGRFWTWIYRLLDWAGNKNCHLEKLKKSVIKLECLFHQAISKNRPFLNEYLEYLEKNGKGYAIAENNYFSTRKKITEWNAATKPFLKLIQAPIINDQLEKFLGLQLPSTFTSFSIKSFHSCQKIIDLEGLVESPLPLSVLKKIIREKPLNAIDQKDLHRWILKIDQSQLQAKVVHKALEVLVDLYTKKTSEMLPLMTRVTSLELYLEEHGCKTFQKSDPKHLNWRQKLEIGTKFILSHSEIILGPELYPLKSGSDQTRAYHLEGEKSLVALIGQNCVVLPLRSLKMQTENHLNLIPALILDMTPDGRLAIIEKLKPLSTIQWLSESHILCPEDEIFINKLGELINNFLKQNSMPLNFSPDNILFNEEYQLKFLKPLKIGPLNFNALVDFIFECSSGNRTIYRALMAKTGLINSTIAKYYRDIISNHFKKDMTALDDLAGIYRISDPAIVDRGTLLISQVKAIKSQLHLRLREILPKNTFQELEAKINKAFLKLYQEHQSAGVLWPNLPEMILRDVLKDFDLLSRKCG